MFYSIKCLFVGQLASIAKIQNGFAQNGCSVETPFQIIQVVLGKAKTDFTTVLHINVVYFHQLLEIGGIENLMIRPHSCGLNFGF